MFYGMRRQARKSETDLRRKSSVETSSNTRYSEHVSLRGPSSEFLSPHPAVSPLAPLPTPPLTSARTSTSTVGRSSFGGLFGLSHRLRQDSEPNFPRNGSTGTGGPTTPGSCTSQSNSLQLSREPAIIIPERRDDDTPAKYLVRLEEAVNRGAVASILSKSNDPFSHAVLRSYMRSF